MSTGSRQTLSVLGLYLDELHQPVAEDHLAGGNGQVLSHLEALGAGGRGAADLPVQVVHQVVPPADQVLASFLGNAIQDLRVGQREVGR